MTQSEKITTIKAKTKWQFIDFSELFQYRELLGTFIERDFKVRYRQTVIGGLWAILQPVTTMVIFSFFFGYIAKISGDGVPYPVFSYSGLILWIYFANALSSASSSVVASASLFTKVYFPRIIIPISATITSLIDYAFSLIILAVLMIYYQIVPSVYIFFLPIILFLTWLLALGMGLWTSAINVKYRDVVYVLPFFIQIMMYATPVIYPISIAPNFSSLLQLNPMTGLVEAHRAILLANVAINWTGVVMSTAIIFLVLVSGIIYFRSVEKYFADII